MKERDVGRLERSKVWFVAAMVQGVFTVFLLYFKLHAPIAHAIGFAAVFWVLLAVTYLQIKKEAREIIAEDSGDETHAKSQENN